MRPEREGVDSSPRLNLDLESGVEEGEAKDGSVSEHTKNAAFRTLRMTTPGWRDGDDNGATAGGNQIETAQDFAAAFCIKTLAGGMTNKVFLCSKPGGENQTVLLRSYGKGTEMFFSRDAELKAFRLLAKRGLGPKLLATFEDGRVEEFLTGRALHAEDMRHPEISILVARRLAELHAVDLHGVDRSPIIFRTLERVMDVFGCAQAMIQNLHKKALDLCGPSYGGVDVVDLGRVIVRLRERLETGVSSKKVFCHNDLQSGNIMYDDTITPNAAAPPPALAPQARAFEGENGAIIAVPHPSEHPSPVPASSTPSASPGTVSFAGRLSLIDYEYSGYNPRGFDLGNHFCEWMADYEKANPHVLDFDSYPEAEEKWRFCRTYLGATLGRVLIAAIINSEKVSDVTVNSAADIPIVSEQFIRTHKVQEVDVSTEDIARLVFEADAYSLASHLMWTIWALLQSKSDAAALGFDYLKYAGERMRAYRHFEDRFLPSPKT